MPSAATPPTWRQRPLPLTVKSVADLLARCPRPCRLHLRSHPDNVCHYRNLGGLCLHSHSQVALSAGGPAEVLSADLGVPASCGARGDDSRVVTETREMPSRWSDYARRLPSSLKDLSGPATGTVVLPLQVAWSGRRAYNVSDERQRLSSPARRTLVHTAMRAACYDTQRWPRRRQLASRLLKLGIAAGDVPHV
jgi:hypothetical protein